MYHTCPLRGDGDYRVAWASTGGGRGLCLNGKLEGCLRMLFWQEDALRCFFQPKELASSDKCCCENCGKKAPWRQVGLQAKPFTGLGLPSAHLLLAGLGNLGLAGAWDPRAPSLNDLRLGVSDLISKRNRKNCLGMRGGRFESSGWG